MTSRALGRLSAIVLLPLLAASVLWRGGKGVEGTWFLVAAGCTVVLLWHASRQRHREVPWMIWIVALLFVLWTAAAFARTLTGNYGLDEVLREGTLLLLFLWAARAARDEAGAWSKPFLRILRFIALLTVAAAAIGLFVYVLQPVNRFVGSFFYYRFSTDYWPNAWAQYLLLAWPVLLWRVEEGSRRTRLLRIMITGVVIGCFFLSYSRGAAVAFAGQLGILLFLLRPQESWWTDWKPAARTFLIAALTALVTFVLVNLARAPFHPVESVSRKVTFTAAEGSSSLTERRAFFAQAMTLASQRPLFGWGPYSFRFIQPRLQESVLQTSDHPHNAVLKLAVERGWPAATLWLALLGLVLAPAGRSLVLRRGGLTVDPAPYLFAGVLGVAAHNLIDYNLQFAGIVLPWTLFLGALAPTARATARGAGVRRIAEVILAVALLTVAMFEFRFLTLSSLGRRAEAAGRTEDAIAWYGKTVRQLFPRDLHLSRAILYLRMNAFVDAERAVDAYLAANREDARAWKIHGELQLKLFRPRDAVRSYRQAFLLSKWNDIGIARGYMQALLEAGEEREIASAGDDVMELFEAFAKAIGNNTHFIALSGNVEQLHELSLLAIVLYPGEAERIRAMDAAAQEHARSVREEYTARRPGFLW